MSCDRKTCSYRRYYQQRRDHAAAASLLRGCYSRRHSIALRLFLILAVDVRLRLDRLDGLRLVGSHEHRASYYSAYEIYIVQRLDHFLSALEPVALELVRRLHDDLLKPRRNAVHQLGRRRDRLVDVHQGNADRVVRVERDFACKHLVHDDSQRIDVALLIDVSASRLLR